MRGLLIRNRPRIWAEIGLLATIYVVILWGLGPRMGDGWPVVALYWALVALGTAIVAGTLIRDGYPPRASFRSAWPPYAIWTLAAGLVLTGMALYRTPDALARLDLRLVGLKFAGYLVFALIQATAFFVFLQGRLERLLADRTFPSVWIRRGLVAAGVGTVFCLIHFPNPPMMLLTAIAGVVWSLIYAARPNVWLLSLSHALLGTLVHRVLQLNTRIGPFYAHPDMHILQHAVPGLRQLFGNMF